MAFLAAGTEQKARFPRLTVMQDATSLPQDDSLPQDLAACHALFVEQAAAIVDLQNRRAQLARENDELNVTLQKLLARLYGRRSERQEDDPNQLPLAFGDDPAVQDGLADAAAEAEKIVQEFTVRRRAKKRPPRSEKFPEHLERYEVVAEVPPAEQHCAEHGPRQIIGYDVTETLEFQQPKLRVRVTKYPKFICAESPECGVTQPPRPAGLVEGNRFDTSIAAEIITAKYAYHLPVYRQQDWFAGSGWMPGRSTLLNIMSSAAYVLEPLYLHYADYVRTSPVIPADETLVMLLLPPEVPPARDGDLKSQRIHEVLSAARAKNKSHVSARMWAYRSLGAGGANVFDFSVSRHRDGPQEFLKHYTGTLLGDCYSGFESLVLASDSRIVRAACHAHARRKVYEAREYHPQEASQLLAWYRQLYDVEDQARGKSSEEVLAVRRQQSVPIMNQMRTWLESDALRRVLPKSPLGEALRYMQNQWDALSVFLEDGRVPIDNNETEQLMKQVATGRKNWLFIGSVEAGYRAAILMTIVSTAHRYHLDIWLYVKDVLDRLLQGERDLATLRADRWALDHPEALRPHRVEEVRYRADAKAVRRARRRITKSQRSRRP
ncbi:MAG TPA: IS66 family transposase [Candidatus Acidoferrum sp.]|nr:IS66 family transposase [Candidatus Acidoferrum sp.]